MVADAGKVLHTAAANQDDRVLLEVVSLTRDVGSDFESVSQAYTGYLTQRRVWLFRRGGINASAHSALLRIGLEGRSLLFLLYVAATLPDELVDCRHSGY
jgi:hypothetical protein